MEWIKIDKNHLPKGEILAANFKAGTYGYKEKLIGYLTLMADNTFNCESSSEMLENCTHYVDIHKHDVV